MTATQLSFDFSAPAAPSALHSGFEYSDNTRIYWRVGMVTSLPCSCVIEGHGGRYTQMLPGVVESIVRELASVRIYAAPEYGYTIEDYPLHLKLAVDVQLRDLGMYGLNVGLQRIADAGLLATGDPELGAAVRARRLSAGSTSTHEREIARVV